VWIHCPGARPDPGIWFGGQIWRARKEPLRGFEQGLEPLWGFGAMLPVGYRDKAPGWVSGAKPPEADKILAVWDCICELNLNFIVNFIEFVNEH